MKNTQESTEFFIPTDLSVQNYLIQKPKPISAIHHLARYEWVSSIVSRTGRLLDVACGSGYGSYIIATNNPELEVIGVDYDPRAIEIAKSRYSAPNLSFRNGDLVRWIYDDNASMGDFDNVVSFDTIEHLNHREIALINLSEHIQSAGSLFFSTPSGHRNPQLNPPWEHHKIEYSGSFLYNLLRRFFNEVYYPDNNTLPNIDYWAKLNLENDDIYWNRMNPLVCKNPIKLGLGN